MVWIKLASLKSSSGENTTPHFLHLCKESGWKRAGCWCRRQKRKRAFLGSPQVEIANGCALGGRRGLARPAIEPPLPMPQAINRHKGCLSDESCSCFSSSVHRLHVMDFRQPRYRNICKPASQGALTPHKQDGLGQSAATGFSSLRSQPPPSLGTAKHASHWMQSKIFYKSGFLSLK